MGRKPKQDLPPKLRALLAQVAKAITAARQANGLTQAQLADMAKISTSTLNEIEKHHNRDIKLSTLVSLAEKLNVNVVSLLLPAKVNLTKNDALKLMKAGEELMEMGKKKLNVHHKKSPKG